MKVTLESTLKLVQQLNLPQIVSKVLREEALPFDLDIHFGCIGEFFLMTEDEQKIYTQNGILPLWDDGNFDRITAYDTQADKFLMYYVEMPEEGFNVKYSYEQLMVKEFEGLWEAEIEGSDLRSIASLFNFKGVECFLLKMNEIQDLDYNEYEAEFDKYISSIDS